MRLPVRGCWTGSKGKLKACAAIGASSKPVLRLELLTRGGKSMMRYPGRGCWTGSKAKLKASAAIGAVDKGREVHDEISRQGLLEHHAVLGNALVDMYVKCGSLRQVQSVLEKLPSVVSWTALIADIIKTCKGIVPKATYACMLKACAAIAAFDKGREVHDEISRQGLLEHHIVLGNARVDMYAKCGSLEKLPFDKGREVHDEISRQGLLDHHIVLGNARVDMHAKCGSLEKLPSQCRALDYSDCRICSRWARTTGSGMF